MSEYNKTFQQLRDDNAALRERVEEAEERRDAYHASYKAAMERVAELEGIVEHARRLSAVRAEFAGVSEYMPEHPGNEYWIEKFMGAYEPLEAALAASKRAGGEGE